MKQRDILFFLVSVCIIVFAWIAFTIVHNSLTSTLSSSTVQAISPINPTFDTDTLNKMKARIVVSPAFTISAVPTTTVSPTATPTPLPPLSETFASSSANRAASQGGTLQQ